MSSNVFSFVSRGANVESLDVEIVRKGEIKHLFIYIY